jgi:hypothetical protein
LRGGGGAGAQTLGFLPNFLYGKCAAYPKTYRDKANKCQFIPKNSQEFGA